MVVAVIISRRVVGIDANAVVAHDVVNNAIGGVPARIINKDNSIYL